MLSTKEIIMLIGIVICELIATQTFLYQRTVGVIGMRLAMPPQQTRIFYPASMLFLYHLSHLKWIILIVLCFIGWKSAIVAAGLIVAFFLLSFIIPEPHYANLLKISKVLASRKNDLPDCVYDEIMKELDDCIKKTEWSKPSSKAVSFFAWFYTCCACGIFVFLVVNPTIHLLFDHKFYLSFGLFDLISSIGVGTYIWNKNIRHP